MRFINILSGNFLYSDMAESSITYPRLFPLLLVQSNLFMITIYCVIHIRKTQKVPYLCVFLCIFPIRFKLPLSFFLQRQGCGVPELRTVLLLVWRRRSDPQRSAKTSGSIVAFCAIVIDKDGIIASITKKRPAEFSDCSRCFYPAGCFRIKFSKFLQLTVLFFR